MTAPFEPTSSDNVSTSLQDVLSKVANGLQPQSASTLGQLIAGGALGSTVTALGTTGTVSLTPTLGGLYTMTPTGNVTLNAASVVNGQRIGIVFLTSGTTNFTINFSNNFKTTGALSTSTVTAKTFVIEFVSDGLNYNEVARTTAM